MQKNTIILLLLLASSLPLQAQTSEVSLASSPALADYAQFEVGEALFKDGNYNAALLAYNDVLSHHSDSLLVPRAYLKLGKSHLNLKAQPQALKNFRLLIENHSGAREAPEARYLIAKNLEQQGKWQAAYLAYEETDLLYPLSFFAKKSRAAAAALKKKHRKKLPRFKANASALFKKGMSYFEQADFESAAVSFSQLAREYPRSKLLGEAWLMLGRAEMQTNNPTAISNLERASRVSGRANYYLGLAYGRRGDYERAIRALKKVDSADATYWAAYYRELAGDINLSLREYYDLIKKYPNSSNTVSAAVWRIGRTYYWNGDFKNAVTYLHLAQLYPAGEDSPRCYFFEAKALERQGKRAAALSLYEKLAARFNHTYYGYRARAQLAGLGARLAESSPFNSEDFSEALNDLDGKNPDELSAIMTIWEQTRPPELEAESSREVETHLAKYKELMNLGLAGYAADEARYLVNLTTDVIRDSAQTKLGEMLIRQGEYRAPIRFADRKIKSAVLAGSPQALPKKIWQLAYPRGYWPQVKEKANSFGLDPYLALAVIREESRFNPRATSRSGARGLMQIMPRTGRGLAHELELANYRQKKLYNPALNIRMGVYYLSNLIKNFSGNVYLSLAGYNGGPNKIKSYVKSWYNNNLTAVDVDEFIESIPIRETRLYVQKVMGSYFEYKRIYDRKRG